MYIYKKIIKEPIEVFSRRWHADGRGKLIEGLRNFPWKISLDG